MTSLFLHFLEEREPVHYAYGGDEILLLLAAVSGYLNS